MKKFAFKMAALALCLFTVSLSLASCVSFAGSFLSEYTGIRTKYSYDTERTYDVLEEDITVTENYGDDSWYYPWDDITNAPETELPETTLPETTNNIPDEFESHVYLAMVNNGRCKALVGHVNVTVLVASDSETSWDSASRASLVSSLAEQEKKLESDAAGYGKELDVTFSFIDVKIEGKTAAAAFNPWEEDIIKAAGFSSKNDAQKELDDQNDADSNPIVIALNKVGRAYAKQQSSDRYTEMLIIYSSDTTAFRHELYHLYGAEDFYYPSEVEELAEEKLPESIMNSGSETDALTAFIIGWDDEMDENAYEFLKGTSHLTAEYLKEENAKELFTGMVADHQLSDGVYTGYLERGVPNGYGKLIYTEGGSYEGYFVYGSYHGEGTRVWKEGDSYSGSFDMGKLHGKGTYTWPSGDKYSGDWVNGVRTGKGTYKWSDGSVYVGDFIEGVRTGNGRFTWSDGTYYEGGFVDNKLDGQGTYVSPSGFRYVGGWKNDAYHGYANVTYSNGSVYEGYFVNGKREGQGTMRYSGGDVYTGSWKADNFYGQGTYTFAYGHKYIGAWENGVRTGYGVMTWSDGSSYDGNWKNNKRHGYGKYINQYGQVFDGQWENDVFQS